MNKGENKKTFFGLTASDKAKIVKQAVALSNKDQLALIEKHGGVTVIKDYCKCN